MLMNSQLEFLDILAIASFVIGLENLEENLTQGDKQELMSELDTKTERVLKEIKKELQYQNILLVDIQKRLEK